MLGMLNGGFLHWDWIRPDHWVPLIQFETEGRIITTVYRYGWMRRSWQPGSVQEIAWKPGRELQIYPLKDRMILRKALVYFFSGLLSMAVFVATVCHMLGVY